MATLTVWKFQTPLGAEQAEHTLETNEQAGTDQVRRRRDRDLAEGRKKPKSGS